MPDKLEKLLQQQAKLKKQIQAEKTKARKKARKDDTRRKILIGAFVLTKMDEAEPYKVQLLQELDGYLTKPHDRALFGFEPLAEG